MLKKGYSFNNIGDALGRAKSAIWTEVNRNLVKGTYDPKKAKHKAYVRRQNAKYQGMKIVQDKALKAFVHTSLLVGQSPAGISNRLKHKREKGIQYISKESIYRYITSPYGRQLEAKLEKMSRKKKYRKKRKPLGILDGRTFIDKRPKHINARMRVGDAEFDFIVSGRDGHGILLTVVDRKVRKSFLEPIYEVSIPAVHRAMQKIKERYPEWNTGTTDNDLLFRQHKILEKLISIRIYFCHPYHSWEKGSIENVNWEIRKDVPKGSDISKYSHSFFKKLELKLNGRFMDCLDGRTPDEAMEICRKQKKLRDLRSRKK